MLPSNDSPAGGNLPATGGFPKSLRLRKRKEFTRLSGRAGKRVIQGFLVVWLENDLGHPRLGLTVSKKVGCAVTRNRIKRCIRESFRQIRFLLPAMDVNVVARRESATMDFSAVRQELEKAFRHIGTPPCSRASRSS